VLHHADLYRLADLPEDAAGEVFEGIGLYDALDAGALTAVEWWEHYRGPAPQRLVVVEFAIEKADDRSILLEFTGPGLARAARELAERVSFVATTSS
jgi:tRNA A37 threonylcarbamoyladenosine biosynthesis protein TsaE